MKLTEILAFDLIVNLKEMQWSKYSSRATIWVRASEQKLYLLDNFYIICAFPCSTAAAGLGNKINSMCTPIGWHEIAHKIGDNLPEGGILEGRKWNGKIWDDTNSNEDLILSRILWLSGIEESLNKGGDVDSYSRCIYIHGTNQEKLLGTAVSKGCIRLSNIDVIELFNLVNQNDRVLISDY
jgi:hypothetical protein